MSVGIGNARTKIPGEWPSSRWSWAAVIAVTFVLQWFWVRPSWGQEFVETGNISAGLKPPVFFLCGWTVPLTGWFGTRSIHIGHWTMRLGRSKGPRFVRLRSRAS